jgi:hypothetical protein
LAAVAVEEAVAQVDLAVLEAPVAVVHKALRSSRAVILASPWCRDLPVVDKAVAVVADSR